MTAQLSLREFFEQELGSGSSQEAVGDLGFDGEVSTQHLVSHLIERTLHRAALDAATRGRGRVSGDAPDEGMWKRHVMVAALTELRPVKLLARN